MKQVTLEELLGKSADDWEKLSDAELEKWSLQFHHVTRPQKIVRSEIKSKGLATAKQQSLAQQALAMAAKLGIKPALK